MKFHIWEFPDVNKILVDLSPKFRNKLSRKALVKLTNYSNISNFYKETSAILGLKFKNCGSFYRFVKGGEGYVRLSILLKLLEILKISKIELERNIRSYKIENGGLKIHHVKLPIKIDTIAAMITSHLMFDGWVESSGRSSYFQKEYKALKTFIQKIEYMVGKVEVKNSRKVFYPPTFLVKLLRKFYEIDSFSSDKVKIPGKIKNGTWKDKLAVVVAAIIDEGHIDSYGITVELKNENLLNDLRSILVSLGYHCSNVTPHKGRKTKIITIYGLSKFHEDIKRLNSFYPLCNLAHKQPLFINHLRRIKRNWWRRKRGVTKINIIKLLSKSPMKTLDLSFKLNIDRKRTLRHLNWFKKMGIVSKVNKYWLLSNNFTSKQAIEIVKKKIQN